MSSPRIHFFLGDAFTKQVAEGKLKLAQLSECFSAFQRAEKESKSPGLLHEAAQFFSNIIFYPANVSPAELEKIAGQCGPADLIVGASAGGRAVNTLLEKLKVAGVKPPKVLAIEAFGLESQPGVVFFRSNGNPMKFKAQEHQSTYEYQDGTQFGGGLMLGHLPYAIRPGAIGSLAYKEEAVIAVSSKEEKEKNKFVCLMNASMDIPGGKKYEFNWLAGREGPFAGDKPTLSTSKEDALVMNFGFIAELAYVVAKDLKPEESLKYSMLAVNKIEAVPKPTDKQESDKDPKRGLGNT